MRITFYFLEEPFGLRQWDPNGSHMEQEALWAPAPLMGWVGHPAHMGTLWVPIIGRDLFFFSSRSSTRLRLVPGSNGDPLGPHMCTRRVHIAGRDL